ncbi:hypothetical protein EVAR_88832_1 [Eumeta japonica]|uniref:Uncharacterized protein n=1 Tax=Eumeta variegata TaxID=151549 RepID=A0A4C1Y434_EUMVA|nr:hypothetical protein EVAR_88832_1 [Eumeta japonica]
MLRKVYPRRNANERLCRAPETTADKRSRDRPTRLPSGACAWHQRPRRVQRCPVRASERIFRNLRKANIKKRMYSGHEACIYVMNEGDVGNRGHALPAIFTPEPDPTSSKDIRTSPELNTIQSNMSQYHAFGITKQIGRNSSQLKPSSDTRSHGAYAHRCFRLSKAETV